MSESALVAIGSWEFYSLQLAGSLVGSAVGVGVVWLIWWRR